MILPSGNRASGISITIVCICLFISTSCSTEVDIYTPGDPIPVVYCLLNPDSSNQYVRIGQTYVIPLDNPDYVPTVDELTIDEEVIVYLIAEKQKFVQQIYYGTLIDPFPKDTGRYPVEANQVYRIPCKLIPACSYSLYVHFVETNRVVFAETKSFGTGFTIIDPEVVPGRSINLFTDQDFFVRFKPVTYGSIYQSMMVFRFLEILNGERTVKSLTFQQPLLTENDTSRSFIEQRISGERFLIDVARNIQPVDGIKRIPLAFDFHVTCAGEDLALKINAENNRQSFSVLEVEMFENAFGVFSCMSHRFVTDFPVSRFTRDTLAKNSLTHELGFMTSQEIDSLYHEYHQ